MLNSRPYEVRVVGKQLYTVPTYEGSYSVVPSTESQTLETAGKKLESDVTIAATPLESKTLNISENGQYSVTPDEAVGLSEVEVNVDVQLLPQKGSIIRFDAYDSGYDNYFIILKIEGVIAEVLSMQTTGQSSFYGVYENSSLDRYLNQTFYNSLSSNIKNAIIDKEIYQGKWYVNDQGSPVYKAIRSGSTQYSMSVGNIAFGNKLSRHCYAMSIQEIIDYLGATPEMTWSNTVLTNSNLLAKFIMNNDNMGLRDCYAAGTSMFYLSYSGYFEVGASSYPIRPVFQIDLSEIDWRQ